MSPGSIPSMWGQFSDESLDVLRTLLDKHGYAATASLPAFRTRRVYPLRDLEHAFHVWQGRAPSLSAVAYPALAPIPVPALLLYRCFFQHLPLDREVLLDGERAILTEAGILDEELRARVQVAAARDLYLLSSIPRRSPGEFVYLGDDTGMLLDWNAEARGKRALDMGTGCGAVALDLSGRFESVLGVDVNETALALAESNARLNGRVAAFARADVWEGVEGTFSWIAANLPALPIDPTPNLSFAAAGQQDPTVLTRRFLEQLPARLEPGGECRMLTFAPLDGLGDRLWREAGERLEKLSLDYRMQDEMELDSPHFSALRHVALHVKNDGQGRRSFHRPPWWRRFSLPFLRPGRALQTQSVGRV